MLINNNFALLCIYAVFVAAVWTQNQQNLLNQNIPNFSTPQTSNGLQLNALGSSLSSSNLILTTKPQVFPVFKYVSINNQSTKSTNQGKKG